MYLFLGEKLVDLKTCLDMILFWILLVPWLRLLVKTVGSVVIMIHPNVLSMN